MSDSFTYQGDGVFLPGVPAQDLDAKAFAALSESNQEAVRESDLYKTVEATAPKRKRAGA